MTALHASRAPLKGKRRLPSKSQMNAKSTDSETLDLCDVSNSVPTNKLALSTSLLHASRPARSQLATSPPEVWIPLLLDQAAQCCFEAKFRARWSKLNFKQKIPAINSRYMRQYPERLRTQSIANPSDHFYDSMRKYIDRKRVISSVPPVICSVIHRP